MRQLTSAEKGRLIGQLENGVSVKQGARNFDVTPATVRYWRRRFEEVGNVDRKQGTGLHRITTRDEDFQIFDASQRQVGDSFLTARRLAIRLGLDISHKTIINRLKEVRIHSRRAAKKEVITFVHRYIRNLFARRLQHLPAVTYHRIIFSDEKVRMPPACKLYITTSL